MGRFINADGLVSTGQGLLGNNMFAYCANNPIVRIDEGGQYWHVLISAAVNGTISLISSTISEICKTQIKDDKFDFDNVAKIFCSVTISSAEGALVALFPSASAGISAAAGALDAAVTGAIEGQEFQEVLIGVIWASGISAATYTPGDEIVEASKLINKILHGLGTPSSNSKLTRFFVKEIGVGFAEDVAYGAMEEYAIRYTDEWISRAYGG